ncbi:M23 family metallopeptidase [Synechococcus sp. AH-601-N23]|nr:M23 family metallopeptidase [Synechococcus sp. AH-601-N23]
MPVHVLHWFSLIWLLNVPGPLPPLASDFDQSLEALERQRVITPQERMGLETGRVGVPIRSKHRSEACRDGALSRQECASGVVTRTGSPRVTFQPTRTQPVRVPVSALLADGRGGFRLESVFAVTPRPLPVQGNGNRALLFPVVGQAFSSSGFGWRLHPSLGSWLMHSGRDFAAPEGAPVVAALSGTVLSSGLAGGYGIAIELDHREPRRRTLYGHLSELYVKAGQSVQQGEVIGRVGSTGLSTGPHLHFELRLPSAQVSSAKSWYAVDPGDFDLAGLVPPGEDPVALLMSQLLESLKRTN